MSYFEISDKFDTVSKHLASGVKMISSLCNFLRSVKASTETYTDAISRSVEDYMREVRSQSTDTLSASLLALGNSFEKSLAVFSQMWVAVEKDVVEPLNLFTDHFNTANQAYVEKGHSLDKALMKKKLKLKRNKIQYLQSKTDRGSLDKSREEYNSTFGSYKDLLQIREKSMHEILVFLQQNEENRIKFMKLSLEKFLTHYSKWTNSLFDTATDLSHSFANINPSLDIRVFVDINKSRSPKLSVNTLKSPAVNPNDLVKETIEMLFSEEPIEKLPQEISKAFRIEEVRVLFADMLESKKGTSPLSDRKLIQLSVLIKYMLSHINNLSTADHYCMCKVLMMSHDFYNSQNQYLAELVRNHEFWLNINNWVKAINKTIAAKLEAEKECLRRVNSRRKKSFIGALKNIASGVFSKNSSEERVLKGTTHLVTSQYILYMSRMKLPPAFASEIVLQITRWAKLDYEKTCNLLAELNVSLNLPLVPIWRERKQELGDLLPIGLALKFLDLSDLLSVTQVCKQWNRVFKNQVIYAYLANGQCTETLRKHCWTHLLVGDYEPIDYNKYVNTESNKLNDLLAVIDLDVARSFRNNSQISGNVLRNILKSMSVYCPEIGYCQGMNYIAGTLYIILRDESLAFNCMIRMFEIYEMNSLFVKDLPKLKQFFYVLDRLIGATMPSLNKTFVEAGLSSSHFASSWFITLFSSCLQSRPNLLLLVWDLFFAKGWRVIFQFSLFVLSHLPEELMGKTFEEIMYSITSIEVRDFIKDDLKPFKVSNKALQALEDEYARICLKANDSR